MTRDVCLECDAGKYLDAMGSKNSADCKACLAGFVSKSAGRPNCQPCGAGKFQLSENGQSCDKCMFGINISANILESIPRFAC